MSGGYCHGHMPPGGLAVSPADLRYLNAALGLLHASHGCEGCARFAAEYVDFVAGMSDEDRRLRSLDVSDLAQRVMALLGEHATHDGEGES